MAAYVYMLRCADGSYYVGSTRNLHKRIWEHGEGLGADYTRCRRPVELVWSAEYSNVGEAFFWEKRIQNWSRSKREALIDGDFVALPGLAKKKHFAKGPADRSSKPLATARPATFNVVTRPLEVVAVTDEFLEQIESRRPGLVNGLYLHGSLCWGEYFDASDIDFVATMSRSPDAEDLAGLEAAHAEVRRASPHRRYEGFYCLIGDLASPPERLGPVPVHINGAFDPAGSAGVNPVTWHELAERGIRVRGGTPRIHTDLEALLTYSWQNLTTYWGPLHTRIHDAGDQAVGEDDELLAWTTLGVARLHHLLARRELTSKSGAGRYVLTALDPRWRRLADEALMIREDPACAPTYDARERGRDVREFLAWAIDDGRRLR